MSKKLYEFDGHSLSVHVSRLEGREIRYMCAISHDLKRVPFPSLDLDIHGHFFTYSKTKMLEHLTRLADKAWLQYENKMIQIDKMKEKLLT